MDLFLPISEIPRIGPVYQKRLKKLGIASVRSLLFHFPVRYEDYSKIIPIKDVSAGKIVCIQGKVLETENIRTFKKRMFITKAIISDDSGAVKVTWFRQPYITNSVKKGDYLCLVGKVISEKNETYLSNPTHEKIYSEDGLNNLIHTGRLVPIYPETRGVSSRWLRSIIRSTLSSLNPHIPETLPEDIVAINHFLPIRQTLWQIHFPQTIEDAKNAEERFAFQELFHVLIMVLRERRRIAKEKAIPIPAKLDLVKDFVESLPFKLTDAQRKAAWRILKDIEKPRPMNRLLQGDVGSGKTVVAMIAALNVIKSGYQAAVMAPTEILARQHFEQFFKLLKPFNINIGLLTGKEDKFYSKKLKHEAIEISRKKLLEKAEKEEINILIGTHTLIQDKVRFGNLGLVILDEQHRFGVEQRAKLSKNPRGYHGKPPIPHLLSMTATPIPRTLALTVYGDLDLSLIDELPKGRKKIVTEIVGPDGRNRVYDFIRKEIKKERQIFVICPRIEPSKERAELLPGDDISEVKIEAISSEILPWSEAKAVKDEYEKLSKEVFPDLKVAMLHGKMAGKEKERVMDRFKRGKTDILVSTSVVEVGIDIPNATVMMIEGADRFGLAQLHQFRGRVGRSKYQSYCFLLTESRSVKTRARLKAILNCDNGFELAEKDLEIRGPGEFFGQRQWGLPDMAMKSLKNLPLVEKTRAIANDLLEKDPELKNYPELKHEVENLRKEAHLE